jgi:predicted DNA-binding protein YlxM (UPF0122 family)
VTLETKKRKLERLVEIQATQAALKAEERLLVNDLRFNFDTSLSEIAKVYGVSRQAIYDRFGK